MLRSVLLFLTLAYLIAPAAAMVHNGNTYQWTISNGWTVIGPTAPSSQPLCGTGTANTASQCWFYVSSSLGNDANVPCTNSAAPCATVFAATQQMADRGSGKPDHINILCGDTIPYNASGSGRVMDMNHVSGISFAQPAVATTYCPGFPEGTGNAPVLLSNCNGGGVQINGNIAIINLRFYNPLRDPGSATYDSTCIGNGNGTGLGKGGGTLGSLLLEGVGIDFFTGVNIQGAISPQQATNVILRRSRIYNMWGGNGFFSAGITNVFSLQENVICNSSWNAYTNPPSQPSALQHNYYFNYGSDTITPPFPNGSTMVADTQGAITTPPSILGNIMCNGSDTDQDRPGGEQHGNVWYQNPGAVSVGGPIVNFTYNVITEAIDYPVSNSPSGIGLTTATQNVPYFLTLPMQAQNVTDNIFAINLGTGNHPAITEQGQACNETLKQCTIPATNYTVVRNTICNWSGTGGGIQRQSAGAILSLGPILNGGGTGGTPGTYTGINLNNISPTSGLGSGASAVVVVGPSGNVTSVRITQFGGVGGLFTAQTASGTPPTLTITGLQAGGFILPNTAAGNSGFIEIVGANGLISASTIPSQLSGTPNGNGVYTMSALPFGTNYSGTAQIFTNPEPIPGNNYVVGDTLGITAGGAVGQIPGLSGFSIQVASIANNTDADNLNTIQLPNCNGIGPGSATASVGNYNASLPDCASLAGGCTATAAAITSSIIVMNKATWNQELAGCSIVNYFQAQFGKAKIACPP